MSDNNCVSVLVVDQQLEHKGILTNCAFVLGLSAGRCMPESTFGAEVKDGAGATHKSLTNIGHYVRKAGQSKLRTLREALSLQDKVTIIDYTEDAAPADYALYAKAISEHSGEQIKYRAIHFYGPESLIVPLTKNLSRLE